MKRVIFQFFCVVTLGLVVFGENALCLEGPLLRPDQIPLEVMAQYGKLDRSMVVFPHDLHTNALAGRKEGCNVCHLNQNGNRSNKFKRLKDTDRKTLLNLYHDNCIGCHQKQKDANLAAGPVECGRCHTDKTYVGSFLLPMNMDASLHYRHVKAYDNKCDACHHEYNAQTKKLYYAKGKEGSCRYCHAEVIEDNRISMRLASHEACVNCHEQLTLQKKKTGPVQCAGCHEKSLRKKIKQVKGVKRIERKQPDTVLIDTGDKTAKARMAMVPFDHKFHESQNSSCQTCHHKAIAACNTCHTVHGDSKGHQVTLEQAMHDKNAHQSCLGCHANLKQDAGCNGCHAAMPQHITLESQTCGQCHMAPKADRPQGDVAGEPAAETAQLAKNMLDSRIAGLQTLDLTDVPEYVTVKALANKYQPAKFPHRKIIKTLQSKINDSRLSKYFHYNAETLCQGCHHNAPATLKPASCGSCHTRLTKAKVSVKPGILGAYHQQCMGCHKNMGLSKPAGCQGCHQEAKKL